MTSALSTAVTEAYTFAAGAVADLYPVIMVMLAAGLIYTFFAVIRGS